jgi:3-oxoacyl-(acyl-carrier-protein) synthase
MTSHRERIVVTGIGVVSPYGIGTSSLLAGLSAGHSCLGPSADVYPGFQGTVARIGEIPDLPRRRHQSRTDRLAVVAGLDAVKDFVPDPEFLAECGIVMATTVAGLTEIEPAIAGDPAAWYRDGGLERAATYEVACVGEAIAETLGLEGPSCGVAVACSSGAIAIAMAAGMLLDGAAPMMLAGGADALSPFTASGFNSLQALDPEPCRPFDQSRHGLNLGEGAAVLALETESSARARNAPILAELRGWAMTNDASHPTAPHPDGLGIAASAVQALEMAGCGAGEVGYVNAHGTGTPLNDIAETRAYERVFGGRGLPIPVSSTKSYLGHCLGAAGALEAAITVLAIRSNTLFPTLRLENPIASHVVDFFRERRRQPLPLAMSVSAGFGGSNASLVFGSLRL